MDLPFSTDAFYEAFRQYRAMWPAVAIAWLCAAWVPAAAGMWTGARRVVAAP
jgi:hypothetical protein